MIQTVLPLLILSLHNTSARRIRLPLDLPTRNIKLTVLISLNLHFSIFNQTFKTFLESTSQESDEEPMADRQTFMDSGFFKPKMSAENIQDVESVAELANLLVKLKYKNFGLMNPLLVVPLAFVTTQISELLCADIPPEVLCGCKIKH